MRVSASCSWCHELTSTEERFCRSCGHEAHKSRMDCACPVCRRWREKPAEVEAEGLRELYRRWKEEGEEER